MGAIFEISVKTPYTEEEIESFLYLTGYTPDEAKDILILFTNAGINNLDVVIKLVKLGYFKTC